MFIRQNIVCKMYFLLVLSKRSIRSKELTCQDVQELHDWYVNNRRTKNSRGKHNL